MEQKIPFAHKTWIPISVWEKITFDQRKFENETNEGVRYVNSSISN